MIEYYRLDNHDCKQSICTKCSLFDQWTQLISELAGGTGNLDEGVANRQKTLILPSAGPLRQENRWATPQNTGTIVSSVILQKSLEL